MTPRSKREIAKSEYSCQIGIKFYFIGRIHLERNLRDSRKFFQSWAKFDFTHLRKKLKSQVGRRLPYKKSPVLKNFFFEFRGRGLFSRRSMWESAKSAWRGALGIHYTRNHQYPRNFFLGPWTASEARAGANVGAKLTSEPMYACHVSMTWRSENWWLTPLQSVPKKFLPCTSILQILTNRIRSIIKKT